MPVSSRLPSFVLNSRQEMSWLKYICKLCGKEFESNTKTAVCTECRTAVCVVCGKEFELKWPYTAKTCSSKCSGIYRKESGIAKASRAKAEETFKERYDSKGELRSDFKSKICAYCGKEFIPNSSRQKYCKGPHYGKCPICGNQIEIKDMYIGPTACSEECRQEAIRRTSLERYGVDNIFKSDIGKQKIKNTMLEKYGVDHYSKTAEYQNKYQSTMQKRYGVNYPMQSKEIHDKSIKKLFQLNKSSDGIRLDSSYEVIVYEFAKRNNLPIERNIPINYEYGGSQHTTFIDFCIEGQLFECKGAHLLSGVYDDAPSMVPINQKLEIYRQNHVIIITDANAKHYFGKPNSKESNGLKYLNKCKYPLIGVDIDLFKKDPVFPYREDRPKCFYNVKVDGNKSSYEAFYDEKIRWKMILNRIQYSGGFIDNNQVLTAMNVTRTCKQPSWFSKSLAKSIIKTYCTTDTIVDCFAGWGTRADASKELHMKYIGIDFNPELITWHHFKGRKNIQFGDAHTFKYDGVCSVFICPPYSDPETGRCFEDYNFDGFDAEAKGLSQCDWLKIVMKNIPNAKEYVMVCKIVDEEFKKYVIDIKINKSHFGLNNEYIILVPNLYL